MLIAFHGRDDIKAAILAQLREHAAADQMIQGIYWANGKGCAVGCTIHSRDHSLYEPRFGIPQSLAHLEDVIFEGLPNEEAMRWPIAFMESIPVGADLTRTSWAFLHRILTDPEITPGIAHKTVRDAVAQCAELMRLYSMGEGVAKEQVAAARLAAEIATGAARLVAPEAEMVARAAARAVTQAPSWRAPWHALQAAARAAELAAYSAESAKRGGAWPKMGNVLLGLLKSAPQVPDLRDLCRVEVASSTTIKSRGGAPA